MLLAGKGGGSSSATARYPPPPLLPAPSVSPSLHPPLCTPPLCLFVSLSHCPSVWIRPLYTVEELSQALKADWDHCVAAVHLIM